MMSHPTIASAIDDFFRRPTLDRFLIAQLQVTESATYEPAANSLTNLELQLSRGSDISRSLPNLPISFQICPRFHYINARIREQEGDEVEMRRAISRLQSCLKMLASSGEGTADAPFKVTFLTDPDDVIRAFGETTRHQQLLATKNGYCDVITTHAGHDFWFDIEPLLERSSVSALSDQLVIGC